MDPTAREDKPHAVCIPVPAQGHINPMLQLAKLLHVRGFHITFVHTEFNYNRILATSGPCALDGLPDFRFETMPEGDQNRSDDQPPNGEQIQTLCSGGRSHLSEPFRQLVNRLNKSGGPKVSCVVSDIFSGFTLEVAAELGIPDAFFCPGSACGFWGAFSFKHLVERGILPLKSKSDITNGYLDTLIDWIPGMKMKLGNFSSYVRTTDHNDPLFNFCKDEVQEARKATAIIINTFDDLECPVLDAMSAELPPVYAVGPLNLSGPQISDESLKEIGLNLWKEDSSCIEWLDRRAPGSVIYVNFGSITVLTRKQLVEFGWGLADSGHSFLWVIRSNSVSEGGGSAILPEELLSEVCERSLIASWCPQEEVLMHPAIGGFLTHCGWNSTLESMSRGVPMICWPYSGENQTISWYLCNEWEVGLRIDDEVKREQVERLFKQLFDGEMGIKMRKMALKWKESAIRAIEPDGKSFKNLERMIKEVLLQREE